MTSSRRPAPAPARASGGRRFRADGRCGGLAKFGIRPTAASASSAARMSSTRSPLNSRSIAARCAATGASPRRSAKAASMASTGTAPHSASARSANRADGTRCVAMRAATRVGRREPLAGQRAIGAELARQPRQEPGRADVGKKADADLRHGEANSGRRRRDASHAPRRRRRRP